MLVELGIEGVAVAPLLARWVEARWIRAHDVEPSVVLGAPALRLGVNTSSPYGRAELATEMSAALLAELGVRDPRVHAEVAAWVSDPTRELFVAFAMERAPRIKLYLRQPGTGDALARVGERLLGAALELERTHTLCIDYVDGRAQGGKRYRFAEAGELAARAPALARFLVERGVELELVAAHVSERLVGGGLGPSATVLHAQLAGFAAEGEDLGVGYARTLGAEEASTLARWCAAVPLFTRVIGVGLDHAAHAVYLGMPHVIDELERP